MIKRSGLIPADGKGFLTEIEALFKADGEYVDTGWFEEQGEHPTADMNYPELANLQATGGGGQFIPRDITLVAMIHADLMNQPVAKRAFDKWLQDPTKDPEKTLLDAIGEAMVEEVKGLFGSTYLHPTQGNPNPLIDSGALQAATSYKTKNGPIKS